MALSQPARAEQVPIKIYTTADGLARDQINRIVRDSRGFLWFCTSEGLSRFDGYKFTNYTTDQGLPHRAVNDLLETRSGVYWIATSGGLTRFNPTGGRSSSDPMFVVYHPGNSKSENVNVLVEDHGGIVWVGMWGGLYRLEQVDNKWTLRFVDIGLPSEWDASSIFAMLEDRKGALWIGTGGGLYRHWPDGRIEHYTMQHGLPSNFVQALWQDQTGQLWAGTKGGLCRLDGEFQIADHRGSSPRVSKGAPSLTVGLPHPDFGLCNSLVARLYTTKDGLPGNWINSLFQSSQGRFWIGTVMGLSELIPSSNGDAPAFRNYTTAHGLSDLGVAAFAEDRDGNLWIGGNSSGGAMKLARSGFTTYSETDGLASNFIASIFEDQAGELCVIDGKNLINRFNGNGFSSIRPDVAKSITYFGWGWNQITFQDGAKEWWVITGQGLYHFPKLDKAEQLAHTRAKAVYTTKDGLAANNVFRLYEDSRGDIWIASISSKRNELSRWERATETLHNYAEELPPSLKGWLPTAFIEDGSDNLWVGFNAGAGLARFSAGRFTAFNQADGVPGGWIRALFVDRAGRLWIAAGQGLSRVDDPNALHPTFVSYTTAQGLSSSDIWSATEDQWGRIYVGTGKGVDRLDPKTGHVEHYTTADGLAHGKVQVAFRDHSGVLWFGVNQGLSRLVPEPDRQNPRPRS